MFTIFHHFRCTEQTNGKGQASSDPGVSPRFLDVIGRHAFCMTQTHIHNLYQFVYKIWLQFVLYCTTMNYALQRSNCLTLHWHLQIMWIVIGISSDCIAFCIFEAIRTHPQNGTWSISMAPWTAFKWSGWQSWVFFDDGNFGHQPPKRRFRVIQRFVVKRSHSVTHAVMMFAYLREDFSVCLLQRNGRLRISGTGDSSWVACECLEAEKISDSSRVEFFSEKSSKGKMSLNLALENRFGLLRFLVSKALHRVLHGAPWRQVF